MLHGDTETEVRRLVEADDVDAAATRALKDYGPEVFSFLVAVLRNEDDAAEVFAEASVHLWRHLPSFRWECSLRTWVYVIARRRLLAFQRQPPNRASRRVPLSRSPVDAIAQEVRTTTAVYLRTEVKEAVSMIRKQLDPDDQTLLILRVDRGLSWREVSRVMDAPEPALRKRFERLKTRLRELAREHGIER
jgi:RNA polymerase sigma-70 factor (ECF subfamily)